MLKRMNADEIKSLVETGIYVPDVYYVKDVIIELNKHKALIIKLDKKLQSLANTIIKQNLRLSDSCRISKYKIAKDSRDRFAKLNKDLKLKVGDLGRRLKQLGCKV